MVECIDEASEPGIQTLDLAPLVTLSNVFFHLCVKEFVFNPRYDDAVGIWLGNLFLQKYDLIPPFIHSSLHHEYIYT